MPQVLVVYIEFQTIIEEKTLKSLFIVLYEWIISMMKGGNGFG